MTTQFVEGQPRHDVRTVEIVGAGSMAGALAAAAGVVLAILGLSLSGSAPVLMVTIATIVLGAALLFEGGTIAARYGRLLRETAQPGEMRTARAELGCGMSAETLAGLAGIALGILALFGVSASLLTPIALIAFGAALLFGSAAASRLNAISVEHFGASDVMRRVLREAVNASVGGELLAGVGAVVLGILALLDFDALALTLVGQLAVGAALLFGGSALGAKMLGILRHERHA